MAKSSWQKAHEKKRQRESKQRKEVFSSITVKSNGGVLRVISTPVHIAQSQAISTEATLFQTFNSIWDTGATSTVITSKVVAACNMKAIKPTIVIGADGPYETNVYLADIQILDKVMIRDVPVTEAKLTESTDVLIGMDIITLGDFAITNVLGNTIMSFRIPSLKTIDYSS